MTTTSGTSDREEIGQLVARFDDATNRGDVEGFRALSAEDAVWEIMEPRPMRAEGVDAIVAKWQALLDVAQWFFRGSFVGVVDVDGDTALGRWPCVETSTIAAPADAAHSGYDNRAFYEDAYVRRNGAWLFSRRRYVCFYISDAPLPGRAVPLTRDLLSDAPSFARAAKGAS